MRATAYTRRGLTTLAFALGVLIPGAVGVLADDTDLFTARVPPNVMFLIDNSASMQHVVWHPAFRTDFVYNTETCPYVADPDDPDYDPKCLQYPLCPIDGNESEFSDGIGNDWYTEGFYTADGKTVDRSNNDSECNERLVFAVDTSDRSTIWNLDYLRWYFSDNVEVDDDGNGRTILEEILDTDDGNYSQCLTEKGWPDHYAKYRRSRSQAAEDILNEVICQTSQMADIRFGLAKFDGISNLFDDPEGGFVTVAIDDYDSAHDTKLTNAIEAIADTTYTPLSESLYNVYRYFMSRDASKTPLGQDESTHFPVYNLNESGGTSGTIPGHPVTEDCQMNFVIVVTDGEPTADDFHDLNLARFRDLIGDYNNPGDETEEVNVGASSAYERKTFYLDDIAKFMHEHDFMLEDAFPSVQTIDVYTVGFTTNETANTLLKKTAAVGGGEFFKSNNPEELSQSLASAIASISAKARAFTAATVPASRATDGNNFFTSYFMPSESPFWQGHLKLFEYNALGEIRDEPANEGEQGECALADPQAPSRCKEGALKLALEGYWDAANEIPPADEAVTNSRNLYVSKYQTNPPAEIGELPPEFTTGNISASDLGVSGATSSDIAAYDLSFPGFDTTGITTDEELADAIVRYVRGCEFSGGSCVDRGDGKKLWDIFHSNPVVVGPPNAALRERTYRQFVTHYKHRKRVVYAGSNGGFVHGFNTGEYDTAEVPLAYDRGTGEEEFGFMAYPARQNIAELPKDTMPRDYYYMDGSPSAADVWFPPAKFDRPNDENAEFSEWHTVLIGGMREGGRAVWALDVTNPPDHNSPSGEVSPPTGPVYPGYLWEFPCERSSCDAWRPYMGETWSQAVITRVRATVGCGTESDWSSCNDAIYDRWVAIFGAGYDPSGDPNMIHDTDGTIAANEYDPSSDEDTKLAGRALFMVDVATGEVLAAKHFQHDGHTGDASDGEPNMKYAIASEPAVFDLDFDGYADVVYVGDLGGNVWKWVIHPPAEDHIRETGGTYHQGRWKFLKILAAENCTSCSPQHYKSFYYPPTGAVLGQHLWLALGSGERNNLSYGQDGGVANEAKNRFYVFKDIDPFEFERTPPDPDDAVLTDVGDRDLIPGTSIAEFNSNTCLGSNMGYYFEGEDGEKFITDSVIFFGVVLTGSYVPATSSASACVAAGQAYLYGFNLLCGEGVFPPESDGEPKQRRVEIGGGSGGLPNAPRVSVGPVDDGDGGGDCTDMVVVITSEGSGYEDCLTERPDSGLRVKSWRDL